MKTDALFANLIGQSGDQDSNMQTNLTTATHTQETSVPLNLRFQVSKELGSGSFSKWSLFTDRHNIPSLRCQIGM